MDKGKYREMCAAITEQSRRERYDLSLYKSERDAFHMSDSLSESGWYGEVLSKPEAAVLIDYFGIEVSELSCGQKNTLTLDILKISGKDERGRKKRAIQDYKTTIKVIEKLKSLQGDIESLNRGFRGETNFSPLAAPDITLATLLFELSENKKATYETIFAMGGMNSRSNPNSTHLCEVAIDAFLRWYDNLVEKDEYGISYSPDYDTLKDLRDDESKDDTINRDAKKTELRKFLEHLQTGMVNANYDMWNFGLTHPSRNALSLHEKRPKYLGQTKLDASS